MLGRSASALLRATPQSAASVRHAGALTSTHIVSPPQVRIPFPEKVAHGIVIALGILAYPLYAINDVRKIKLAKFAENA